jgi:hypothetical protein
MDLIMHDTTGLKGGEKKVAQISGINLWSTIVNENSVKYKTISRLYFSQMATKGSKRTAHVTIF